VTWLAVGVLFWAGGMLLAVFVAWVVTASNDTAGVWPQRVRPDARHSRWWNTYAPTSLSRDLRMVERGAYYGLRMRMFVALASGRADFDLRDSTFGLSTRSGPGHRRTTFDLGFELTAGWPWYCVRGRRFDEDAPVGPYTPDLMGMGRTQPNKVYRQNTLPLGPLQAIVPSELQQRFGPSLGRFLPTRLIWGGLALNGAFYGGGLALITLGPILLRKQLRIHKRRRRGLCLSCGYDLKGTGQDRPCPECGACQP
jgi:hypothetical protein